jgi:hypothetical protein
MLPFQRNDDGVDSQLDFRLGKGPAWSDNSALRIKHGLVVQSNYEGSRHEISFWVTQPSRRIHFGFEGSLQKEGRNFDAAINLRATPGTTCVNGCQKFRVYNAREFGIMVNRQQKIPFLRFLRAA